ncbi:MAG: hypothetical protein GF344_09065, partial [Chitinivibrionales bacterium]|nr:hypothetical protein [Chitinivibrionales bacterium]
MYRQYMSNGKIADKEATMGKRDKRITTILSAIKEEPGPVSSSRVSELLSAAGNDISERTVRLYLKETDHLGLTESKGRKGRTVTEKGLDLLRV